MEIFYIFRSRLNILLEFLGHGKMGNHYYYPELCLFILSDKIPYLKITINKVW